ncbi:MAG TPA: hypothetical protein VF859_11775 [Burkholderiales bacterium]
MKNAFTWILSLSLVLASAAQAAGLGAPGANGAGFPPASQNAADNDDPASAATYDVFIDEVTGYAFIKTPFGWKFVRNLRAEPATEPAVSQR